MVEQGTENPCVGGSIPSLATFGGWGLARRLWRLLLPGIFLTGCQPDACERLCSRMTNRVADCLGEWPADWEDLDATRRRDFADSCQTRWSDVRAELEPRELDDAFEQCQETIDALAEMTADGTDCDKLRALYLW